MYRDIDVIKSGGIELRGMKASLAPRRQQSQAAPKLEQYTFVPYTTDKVFFLPSEHYLFIFKHTHTKVSYKLQSYLYLINE